MKQIMTPRGMLPEYWIAERQEQGENYGGTIYHAYNPHNILYSNRRQFLILQWEEGESAPILRGREFDTREQAEKALEQITK